MWENIYESNKNFLSDVALVFQNKKISYRTLFSKTCEVANAIVDKGIKKGDRIIICSTGTPETVYLLLACSKVGVCAEMINLSLGTDAIFESLRKSSAQYIFCLDKVFEKIQELLMRADKNVVVIPALYSLPKIYSLLVNKLSPQSVNIQVTYRWDDFLATNEVQYEDNTDPNSELVVVFSSGSTGEPKAILHSNRSYTAMSEQYRISEYPFQRKDVFLNQIPFFIASGLSFMLIAPLMLGITVILEPQYEPTKWVDDIFKYKPKVICATKSFWEAAIQGNMFKGRNLSFLKIAVQGGEPNTVQMEKEINDFLRKSGCEENIVVGYGMSEMNGTLTTSSFKYHKLGSAGIPLPGTVVCAFDTSTNRECRINERGELMVMSPCAMKGYASKEAQNDSIKWVDTKGKQWYRTGDVGYVDDQGELFVLGRAEDKVSISDQTLYLFDIENELMNSFNMSACKVVANENNEVFVNYILRQGERTTINEVGKKVEKILPSKVPRKIKEWTEFPINANGKCDRNALKE